MEFAGEALTCSTHAEQAATVNAWVQGEQGLRAIAVNAAPCGYCRQFLYELVTASHLTLVFNDAAGQTLTESLSALLPWAVGPQDFGVQGGLMTPQAHHLVLAVPDDDAGVRAALDAANRCYAPYSHAFAGVGVVMRDGTVYASPLAENTGYNPSLSPLEGALSCMNVCGHTPDQIQAVTLVEVAGGQASQANVTRAVLSAVSTVALTTAYAVPSSSAGTSQKRP
jgi:cytidine deaminase